MRRALIVCIWLTLTGCVHGYGCLFLQPVKHTLVGRVHFRSFPAADGIDNVPILALERTAYVYSPAHSYTCMAAPDVQLVGGGRIPGEHHRKFPGQRHRNLVRGHRGA